MERPQVHVKPTAVAGVNGSAKKLGAALAKQQLPTVQDAYAQRYEQGISSFWQSQLYTSEEIGKELAALRLEAQRQFAIKVFQTVLLMGVQCGLIGAWTFGAVVGGIFLIGSLFLGMYFGSI